jgi:hypothetical protein
MVCRAEVWAEDREVIDEQEWEGHEVGILDVGLFLGCLEERLLRVQVRSFQVELWHVGEGFAEEVWGVWQVLQVVELVFYAAVEVLDSAIEVRARWGDSAQ